MMLMLDINEKKKKKAKISSLMNVQWKETATDFNSILNICVLLMYMLYLHVLLALFWILENYKLRFKSFNNCLIYFSQFEFVH